jgi:orotidine-5'-phosphate decarboxylase
MLTLHAAGGREMLQEAVRVQRESAPQVLLLGVTVLTSLGQGDARDVGIADGPEIQVLRLARLAWDAGLRGLVCSSLETPRLRAELPAELTLVTPGIRPAGSDSGDQRRVATPAEAARAGSNYIVVGRPILQAADPLAAAQAVMAELNGAGLRP